MPDTTEISSGNMFCLHVRKIKALNRRLTCVCVGQTWWVSERSVAFEKNFLVLVTSCSGLGLPTTTPTLVYLGFGVFFLMLVLHLISDLQVVNFSQFKL